MATLAMATADYNWLTLSGVTASTDQARTGAKSYKFASGTHFLTLPFAAKSTFYFRVAIYNPATVFSMYFREGTSNHVQIKVLVGEAITVHRNTILIGSTTYLPVAGWQVLEGKIVIHNSTGQVTLKINGNEIYDLNNVDTQNAGTGVVDNLYVYGGTGYLDDIVLDDADYPGLGGIEVLLPDSDGSDTAWTGGYADVDDNPADDDTSYIYTDAATAGTAETFTFPNCTAYSQVARVGLVTKSKLDGVGSGTIAPTLNGSAVAGTALSTSYQWVNRYFDVDPADSGAWTEAKVNAIEAGVVSG